MNVGNNVARFRERRGWSQAQLAEKAGVSRAHLNHVERGLSQPTTKFTAKLEVALGLESGMLTSPGEIIHLDDLINSLPLDVLEYLNGIEGHRVLKLIAEAKMDADTLEHLIAAFRAMSAKDSK